MAAVPPAPSLAAGPSASALASGDRNQFQIYRDNPAAAVVASSPLHPLTTTAASRRFNAQLPLPVAADTKHQQKRNSVVPWPHLMSTIAYDGYRDENHRLADAAALSSKPFVPIKSAGPLLDKTNRLPPLESAVYEGIQKAQQARKHFSPSQTSTDYDRDARKVLGQLKLNSHVRGDRARVQKAQVLPPVQKLSGRMCSPWPPAFVDFHDHVEPEQSSLAQSNVHSQDEDRVLDVDSDYRDNHLYCTEYVTDIFEHLQELERKHAPSSSYMRKQKEITAEMRAILIDWLIEFAQDFNLVPETLSLTVNYIDRFLSRKNVPKHRLQLVGVTAIYIASKYEEISPCSLEELVEFCDHVFPTTDVAAMEWCILDALRYELNAATVHVFVTRFQQIAHHMGGDDERLPHLIHFLAELSYLEYPMLQYSNSLIAISAVVLALHTLRHTHWNSTLEFYSGYTIQELRPCLNVMHSMYSCTSRSLEVIWKKYSRKEYCRVSAILPRSSPPS